MSENTTTPASPLTNKQKVQAIIAAAMAIVYTDEVEFTRVIASEFALSNLGQELSDHVRPNSDPRYVIRSAWQQLLNDSSGEGVDIEPEYRMWARKDAPKLIKAIKAKKLPLTPQNARDAFDKKGPWAKK